MSSTLTVIENVKTDAVLQSTICHYRTFDNIGSIDIFEELTPHLDKKCDHMSPYTIKNEYELTCHHNHRGILP